jgi:hypothetical protein
VSHIATISTEIKDEEAIVAACIRLNLPSPKVGSVKLYSELVTGTIVKLPGWLYPIVIDPSTGGIKYDNYGGAWGNEDKLNAFKQAYAIEKAKLEARKNGYRTTEAVQSDGSVKLTLTASR